MRELTSDVIHIPLSPRDGINAYLIGDVLVDAGLKGSAKKILRGLTGRDVRAHLLTHAHIDHVGGSKRVVDALGIPVWAGAGDAEALERGEPRMPKPWMDRFGRFPALTVDRRLTEGDEVAGFTVLDSPGHTPGHISLWRESDRVLAYGDVFNNMNLFTTKPGFREPPALFASDRAENKRSMKRLAALEPALVLAGHGPPLRDPAALKRLADSM